MGVVLMRRFLLCTGMCYGKCDADNRFGLSLKQASYMSDTITGLLLFFHLVNFSSVSDQAWL